MDQPNITPVKKRKVLFNNFLGGIAWGIGATIGVSIVLALMAFVVQLINPVPIVGNFVTGVYEYVLDNNPRIRQVNFPTQIQE